MSGEIVRARLNAAGEVLAPSEIAEPPIDWELISELDDGRQMFSVTDTPGTDAAVVTMLRLDGDADVVVDAYFARTLERELNDLKQRILPQYLGRAERAENAKRMAEHERDEMLEKLRAATSMPCAPSATAAQAAPVEVAAQLDERTIVNLVYEHFDKGAAGVMLFERWKDGIELDYPTEHLKNFCRALLDGYRMKSQPSGCTDAGGQHG